LREYPRTKTDSWPMPSSREWATISSLTIYLCGSTSSMQILSFIMDSFILPNLTHLHIESFGTEQSYLPNREWPKESFTRFFQFSSCHLEALTLNRVPLLDTDLLTLLNSTPSLLQLDIDDRNIETSPITSFLIEDLRLLDIIPRLRILSMIVTTKLFDDSAFLDMIRWRWAASVQSPAQIMLPCLIEVNLTFPKRKGSRKVYRIYRGLEDLEGDGKVRVSWGNDRGHISNPTIEQRLSSSLYSQAYGLIFGAQVMLQLVFGAAIVNA